MREAAEDAVRQLHLRKIFGAKQNRSAEADMQLALWPLSALENEVKGLRITEVLEEVLEPHWQRTVSDSRGRDVLVIQAEEGPLTADEIHIRHESYQLTIRTIERELTESTND